MKSPRFAIENVLHHLSEHFTYLNSGEDKGVRIIESLLYCINAKVDLDFHSCSHGIVTVTQGAHLHHEGRGVGLYVIIRSYT